MAETNVIDMNLEGEVMNVSETTETSGLPIATVIGVLTAFGLGTLGWIKTKSKREEKKAVKKAAKKQKKLAKMARTLEKEGYFVCPREDCVDPEYDVEDDE